MIEVQHRSAIVAAEEAFVEARQAHFDTQARVRMAEALRAWGQAGADRLALMLEAETTCNLLEEQFRIACQELRRAATGARL